MPLLGWRLQSSDKHLLECKHHLAFACFARKEKELVRVQSTPLPVPRPAGLVRAPPQWRAAALIVTTA